MSVLLRAYPDAGPTPCTRDAAPGVLGLCCEASLAKASEEVPLRRARTSRRVRVVIGHTSNSPTRFSPWCETAGALGAPSLVCSGGRVGATELLRPCEGESFELDYLGLRAEGVAQSLKAILRDRPGLEKVGVVALAANKACLRAHVRFCRSAASLACGRARVPVCTGCSCASVPAPLPFPTPPFSASPFLSSNLSHTELTPVVTVCRSGKPRAPEPHTGPRRRPARQYSACW